jgi:putative DNA primase/helicase
MAGCAVKLTEDEDICQGLHVGEGVETMLAAMMLGFAPAWATGGTGNLKNFPVLGGIDALTIIVDHDANSAGQAAASECFDRWTEAAREVWNVLPNGVGVDMNDIVAGDK